MATAPSSPPPLFDPVPLQLATQPLPPDLQALCEDAVRRAARIQALGGADRMGAFQMCHGPSAYRIVRALQALRPNAPTRWLELGSGLGLASCLADALGWAATGLEIEPRLVSEARALAAAHGRQPSRPSSVIGSGRATGSPVAATRVAAASAAAAATPDPATSTVTGPRLRAAVSAFAVASSASAPPFTSAISRTPIRSPPPRP